MPVYEYKCTTCGKELEVLQSSHENFENCVDIDKKCQQGGKVIRKLSTFAYNNASESIQPSLKKDHVHSKACRCHPGTYCTPSN